MQVYERKQVPGDKIVRFDSLKGKTEFQRVFVTKGCLILEGEEKVQTEPTAWQLLSALQVCRTIEQA